MCSLVAVTLLNMFWGRGVDVRVDVLLTAFVAISLRRAIPPVEIRAVCLLRAIGGSARRFAIPCVRLLDTGDVDGCALWKDSGGAAKETGREDRRIEKEEDLGYYFSLGSAVESICDFRNYCKLFFVCEPLPCFGLETGSCGP